jgi:hypothetical protein
MFFFENEGFFSLNQFDQTKKLRVTTTCDENDSMIDQTR